MNERLFVYGTLRRGGSREIEHHFAPVRFLSGASITGTLYDMGPYPGIRLEGSGIVCGEVYALDSSTLTALDAYEGFAPEAPETSDYQRPRIEARLTTGETCECWVYEITAARILGCPAIPSGDWIVHAATRDPQGSDG